MRPHTSPPTMPDEAVDERCARATSSRIAGVRPVGRDDAGPAARCRRPMATDRGDEPAVAAPVHGADEHAEAAGAARRSPRSGAVPPSSETSSVAADRRAADDEHQPLEAGVLHWSLPAGECVRGLGRSARRRAARPLRGATMPVYRTALRVDDERRPRAGIGYAMAACTASPPSSTLTPRAGRTPAPAAGVSPPSLAASSRRWRCCSRCRCGRAGGRVELAADLVGGPSARRRRRRSTAAAPDITAPAGILTDADGRGAVGAQGTISARAMASTTKIMTAIVVLENAKLSDECDGLDGRGGASGSPAPASCRASGSPSGSCSRRCS